MSYYIRKYIAYDIFFLSALLLLFSPIVYFILPETKDVRLEVMQ